MHFELNLYFEHNCLVHQGKHNLYSLPFLLLPSWSVLTLLEYKDKNRRGKIKTNSHKQSLLFWIQKLFFCFNCYGTNFHERLNFLMQKDVSVVGQGNIYCLYYVFGKWYATCIQNDMLPLLCIWKMLCFHWWNTFWDPGIIKALWNITISLCSGIWKQSLFLTIMRKPLSQKVFLISFLLSSVPAVHHLNVKDKSKNKNKTCQQTTHQKNPKL